MVYQQLQGVFALLAALANAPGIAPASEQHAALVATACQCASSSCNVATRLLKNEQFRCSYSFRNDPSICQQAQALLEQQLSSMQAMCMTSQSAVPALPGQR